MIDKDVVVADIGTDHAHLPIYLVQNGAVCRAIASDIKNGPLAVARENVSKQLLDDRIELRLGGGLSPYQVGEVDVFVIAGMGGHTIADILAADDRLARSVHYLVLQPMQNRPFLRSWLYDNGYAIDCEVIARESDKFYHILKVRSQRAAKPADFSLEYGVKPIQDDAYYAYIDHLIAQKDKLAKHFKQCGKAQEYRQICIQIEQLKGVSNARNS